MSNIEKTKGIITFEENEYSFLMENNILQILPGSKKQHKDFVNRVLNNFIKKWTGEIKFVPIKILKGITLSNENIEIMVSDNEANENGFLSYPVITFMKVNKKYSIEKVNKIRLEDDFLKYCIPPEDFQKASLKLEKNKKFLESVQYQLNQNLDINLGSFSYNDIKIAVICNGLLTLYQNSLAPLSTKVYLDFCFEKALNFNNLNKIIHIINNSFKFIYRNTNAVFDSFILYNDNNKCGEIKITKKPLVELEKLCAINLNFLLTSYARILQEIGDDNFTLNHIPGNNPNLYSPSRYMNILESFESEFSMYPEAETTIRSEEFFTIRDEISTLINEKIEENSGHKKKYWKEILKSVNFSGNSISQKYNLAIAKNKNILKPVIYNYLGNSEDVIIEKITERTNKIRNSYAHGHLDFERKPEDVYYIIIIEILIYSMELKRVKVSETDIKAIINELFHLNIPT
jgi:hypothetical protein